MPQGTYLLQGTGHEPGPYALERFSCAAGPAGWRYVATREHPETGARLGRLDVVLDESGAAVRVQVEAGGWVLRGGVVGGQVLWRRGDEEHSERAVGFTGTSPVWALAAARLAGPQPRRLRLVRLGDEALATRVVEQGWVRTGQEQRGGVEVVRLEVADLDTGERRALHVSGDLLLDAPGSVLLDLQG